MADSLFISKTKIQQRLRNMYSGSVSAACGKTFTGVHSKRAVHWTEDINVRVECVTEIHGDLHHLADSSDLFFAHYF